MLITTQLESIIPIGCSHLVKNLRRSRQVGVEWTLHVVFGRKGLLSTYGRGFHFEKIVDRLRVNIKSGNPRRVAPATFHCQTEPSLKKNCQFESLIQLNNEVINNNFTYFIHLANASIRFLQYD